MKPDDCASRRIFLGGNSGIVARQSTWSVEPWSPQGQYSATRFVPENQLSRGGFNRLSGEYDVDRYLETQSKILHYGKAGWNLPRAACMVAERRKTALSLTVDCSTPAGPLPLKNSIVTSSTAARELAKACRQDGQVISKPRQARAKIGSLGQKSQIDREPRAHQSSLHFMNDYADAPATLLADIHERRRTVEHAESVQRPIGEASAACINGFEKSLLSPITSNAWRCYKRRLKPLRDL